MIVRFFKENLARHRNELELLVKPLPIMSTILKQCASESHLSRQLQTVIINFAKMHPGACIFASLLAASYAWYSPSFFAIIAASVTIAWIL